jgi:hypothetical protein
MRTSGCGAATRPCYRNWPTCGSSTTSSSTSSRTSNIYEAMMETGLKPPTPSNQLRPHNHYFSCVNSLDGTSGEEDRFGGIVGQSRETRQSTPSRQSVLYHLMEKPNTVRHVSISERVLTYPFDH